MVAILVVMVVMKKEQAQVHTAITTVSSKTSLPTVVV